MKIFFFLLQYSLGITYLLSATFWEPGKFLTSGCGGVVVCSQLTASPGKKGWLYE